MTELRTMLDANPHPAGTPIAGPGVRLPLIQIRGLTKLYRMGETDVRALDGVDLDVEQGEFVAITGASGSGKSTMMHLLGCLDRPTSGAYRLNNRNVAEMSDRELAAIRNQYIGFVFQTFNLINRTPAVDNVAIPLFYARQANTGAAARAALQRVGLEQRSHHKPGELSGGERQRVAIARAIVNDPVLLLADEPTGNLDSRTGEQIMQVFHSLNAQGVTIVLVTHEPDVAVQARRVVQMRDGRIISDGPPEEIYPAAAARAVRRKTEDDEDLHAQPGPAAAPTTSLTGAPDALAGPAASLAGPAESYLNSYDSDLAVPPTPPSLDSAPPAQTPANYSDMPQRRMGGATAALIFGILAIGLLLTAAGLFVIVTPQAKALKESGVQFGPNNPPPVGLVLMWLGGMAAVLFAVISAVVAIFVGRGVRKRIRLQPGNWTGGGHARTGMILGWTTVAIPLLWVVGNIVFAAIKRSGG